MVSPARRDMSLISEAALLVADNSETAQKAAGDPPPVFSPRQQTAITNVQRHWRGLTRRVHVLRKWSWLVSNGLENREEQRMVELGLFVESIAEELAPGPSLERRSTDGGLNPTEYQGATGGLQSVASDPK